MDILQSLRQIPDLDVETDVPMSAHTSFAIGGPADILVVPHAVPGLVQALRTTYDAGLTPTIIGNGTNTLVLDGGIRGVVIKVANGLSRVQVEDDVIIAESGARVACLCRVCADRGLGGMEWAAGIPGALGGALTMNAGANGGEIGQFVQWVKAVTPAGEIRILHRDELSFGYRDSCFRGGDLVIAQAALRLIKSNPATVTGDMLDTLKCRSDKQPVTMCSAGCVFKRPLNDYAGRLLDEAGAKGMRVGGAVVSTKHANFIVNAGDATARDVLELIDQVRDRVKVAFGVDLVVEVCVVGEPLPASAFVPVMAATHSCA